MKLGDMIAALDAHEAEIRHEETALFAGVTEGSQFPEVRAANGMPLSSSLNELIEIFRQEPLLLGPALAWAREMRASIEYAKLAVLYTEEQIADMRAALEE